MAFRPKDTKERIAHRLKIVSGHLKKVQQMLDDDVYCIDIIHQSQAIQKALRTIDEALLENHLNGCVAESIREGKTEEATKEVLNVFRKAN